MLVIGASGSLGTAAVQLARSFGARVTGVCSTRNAELVKSLGAQNGVDYAKTDFTQVAESYDVIFDTISNTSYGKYKHLLRQKGVYVSPVLKFSLLADMLYTRIFSNKKAKFDAAGLLKPQQLRGYLEDISQLIIDGKLRVIIDKQYTLPEAAAAHRYVDTGRKRGNVVLTVVHTPTRNRTETLATYPESLIK